TVGHNNITRCPSCAEEGHDRSGDNLSILIEDPRKDICWAGCTRDTIRAAVGRPRPVQHALHGQKKEASNVEIQRQSDGLARGEIPRGGPQRDGLPGRGPPRWSAPELLLLGPRGKSREHYYPAGPTA